MEKLKIEEDLKKGLRNNEFKVFLQPKFDAKTEKIVGAEALIRREKNNKLIMPDEFINKYEEIGIITDLNLFVFESICKKQKEWKEKKYKLIPIAINKSIKDLSDIKYIEKLKQIIEKYEVDPKLIELELTENVVIKNIDMAKKAEENVRSLGFMVSMDDFGIAYSSFYMLRNINIDILKIDREFLKQIINDERGKIIIETIIEMAKKLKIKTVVEGVEKKEQAQYLRKIGCDMFQGYYYQKPINIEEFERIYLKNNKKY